MRVETLSDGLTAHYVSPVPSVPGDRVAVVLGLDLFAVAVVGDELEIVAPTVLDEATITAAIAAAGQPTPAEVVAAWGPGARVFHASTDGFVTFSFDWDTNPARFLVTRADRPSAWHVCDTYTMPDSIPLSDFVGLIAYAVGRIQTLRTADELVWQETPRELLAKIIKLHADPALIAQVARAID